MANGSAKKACVRNRFSPTPLPFPLTFTSASLSVISNNLVKQLVPFSISVVEVCQIQSANLKLQQINVVL
jgi:hypothetical protein